MEERGEWRRGDDEERGGWRRGESGGEGTMRRGEGGGEGRVEERGGGGGEQLWISKVRCDESSVYVDVTSLLP